MATVVYNFDLYNTTNYWLGYSLPNYITEQNITQLYYSTQFSSNIIGSQVDFFNALAGNTVNNPIFTTTEVTLDELPFLWESYWWEEAIYYSHPIVKNTIFSTASDYYQNFSESVGSLYFVSKVNNLSNTETIPYNSIIGSLLPIGITESVTSFYETANTIFVTNIENIGPGNGTDTSPNNGSLIMADTDLTRRVDSIDLIQNKINELYPKIKNLLPINTTLIGNLITPYNWSLSANLETSDINVDFINNNLLVNNQLTIATLKTE